MTEDLFRDWVIVPKVHENMLRQQRREGGCGTGHMGHKYFCKRANVSAFSTQVEAVIKSDINLDDVLLQVMKIPNVQRNTKQY